MKEGLKGEGSGTRLVSFSLETVSGIFTISLHNVLKGQKALIVLLDVKGRPGLKVIDLAGFLIIGAKIKKRGNVQEVLDGGIGIEDEKIMDAPGIGGVILGPELIGRESAGKVVL